MDTKSIKLLTKYYCPWAFGGVQQGDQSTAEELAYLHARGIHPEAVLHITHAQATARLRKAVAATELRAVSNAFIVGLDPDRCVHRTALRAYAIGLHFPAHSFQPHSRANPCPACRICGMSEKKEIYPAYLEMLRHRDRACGSSDQPFYAAYALERFNASEVPQPTVADFERFRGFVGTIRNAGPGTTATALANAIRPVLKGNKYTRSYVVETLGYCSILETADCKGYLNGWVSWIEHEGFRTGEIDLPAARWRGKDGINLDALRHFFPHPQIKL